MNRSFLFHRFLMAGLLLGLAGCGDPRAVALPLEYPDGTPVRTVQGEPVMAGYQTYGSATHANATAIYEMAKPASCLTCAQVGAVVSEPSTLRQATGVLGTASIGAGAVMTGIGVMDYGAAARGGKLRDETNINQNTSTSTRTSTNTSQAQSSWSRASSYGDRHNDGYDNHNNWDDRRGDRSDSWGDHRRDRDQDGSHDGWW